MTEKTTNKEPGLLNKAFDAVGDVEWKIADKLLGQGPSDNMAQSVNAFSKGQVKKGWDHANEAEKEFTSHAGVEGTALPGLSSILGTMIHNATGSPDYKPLTDALTPVEKLSQNHSSVMAAASHDVSTVKEWITGGQEVKATPAQTLPSTKVPGTNSETKR